LTMIGYIMKNRHSAPLRGCEKIEDSGMIPIRVSQFF